MVIMDHNTNVTGSQSSSQVISNGIHSIQSGISNGIQSIQQLPPQVYVLKEKIVNKSNNYHLMDGTNNNNNVNSNNFGTGLKDYGEGGMYSFEDDGGGSSESPSRLRSLSAPGSTSNNNNINNTSEAVCTGTKNQRELFQQSIDSLAARFNNSNTSINNSNSNSNSNNNICSTDKSPLKNSGGSGSCGSFENDDQVMKMKLSSDELYESEELSNIDEVNRMRSLSLTSYETLKRMERDRNLYSPPSSLYDSGRDDVLSPYEMMNHLEYQERLEREELERTTDKNSVIISQYSSESYQGNQVKYETEIFKPTTSTNTIPRISVSNSNSFSGTPTTSSSMCISPPPTHHNGSHSLSGSLNGTSVFNNNNNSGATSATTSGGSPITSFTNSPNRSSPLFKRSLTSNTALSKSASKLPTIQQQAQQMPPQQPPLPTSPLPQNKKVLVKSYSSQTILKEQQQQQQQMQQQLQQQLSNKNKQPQPQPPSLSLSTAPTQASISSPNLNPLKKLSNKLSLSTHSLPQPQQISNIPNKLLKSPSGNSISRKSSINSSTNHPSSPQPQQHINNSFQMELKQHLKKKQELNSSSGTINVNNLSNTTNSNINISSNSNIIDKKERFEIKKSNLQKPMDEPIQSISSSNNNSIVKITFQFISTGKKVNRYFNSDCKVFEIKTFIEWLAYQEPQLFDNSFKLSDDSYSKIVDYDFEYTILPTKFIISNFDVTFKDSGFNINNQKSTSNLFSSSNSNLINISLV